MSVVINSIWSNGYIGLCSSGWLIRIWHPAIDKLHPDQHEFEILLSQYVFRLHPNFLTIFVGEDMLRKRYQVRARSPVDGQSLLCHNFRLEDLPIYIEL